MFVRAACATRPALALLLLGFRATAGFRAIRAAVSFLVDAAFTAGVFAGALARDTFADRVVDAVVAALLSRLIVFLASALVVFARAAPALEVDFDLLFFIAGFALGI